jgi:ribosome-associated protein
MLTITSSLAIDDAELGERFVRSSGPGGQNVNKVSTAVELRFDVRRSPSLPHDVAIRLMKLAGSRMTKDGVLVIQADRHRTQDRNRDDARQRLVELVKQALVVPRKRIATKPGRAAKERRLESKGQRSLVKKLRRAGPASD